MQYPYAIPDSYSSAGGEIATRLTSLEDWNHPQLQAKWRRLFRAPPPKRISRDVLRLGIAWKLQERMRGGHGRPVMRQLTKLADMLSEGRDVALPHSPSLKAGARLVREWNGETHDVLVVEGGFRWRGKTWTSLSTVARQITGTRWSGPRFFGLTSGNNRGALRPTMESDKPEEACHDPIV